MAAHDLAQLGTTTCGDKIVKSFGSPLYIKAPLEGTTYMSELLMAYE